MGPRDSSLLALIHQHLLQHGYAKAARELQIESGEKFPAQNVSLKRIFKHWTNKEKSKSSKQNDASSKKPRVQNPVSLEEDKGAHPKAAVVVAQNKKGSAKKTPKIKSKPVTSKKMNSAKKSATKVKGSGKMETPSLNDKPVPTEIPAAVTKSSDDSDSEEETVPAKATPVQAPPITSPPAAARKRKTPSTTAPEPIKREKSTPTKTTPATANKKPQASNGKSTVKNDVDQSSESSDDETDIEKQPVVVTPAPARAKAAKAMKQTPSITAQPKADTSESSESESEEEAQQLATPAVLQVKAAKTTAAAQLKPAKGKSVTRTTALTPVSRGSPAVGKTPAKSAEDSATGSKAVPATPKASKQKVLSQSAALPAVDSSSSSESESEEEPVQQNQKTTASPKKGAQTPSAQVSKLEAVVAANADSSDTSEDSDSESETEAPEQKAASLPSNVKTPVPSVKQPVATSPKTKSRVPPPPPAPADETSGTEDSDSDEEPETEKAGSQLQTSPIKTPSTGAAAGKARTPMPTAAAADSSESEDSDSDEEPEAVVLPKIASPLPASNVKTPSTGAKQPVTPNAAVGKAGNLVKATADDSSETDDSDSDEDQRTKAPTPAKGTPISKSTALTPASHVSAAALRTLSQTLVEETSDESDSDDEPSSALKASGPTTVTPLVKLPAAVTTRVPDSDADSESSDSSDSEEKVKTKVPAVVSLTKSAATPSAAPLTAPKEKTPAAGKVSAVQTPSSETSESSDSSDEDLPPAQGLLTPKHRVSKLSLKPKVAAQSKARSPAKPVPDTKLAATEESSDSSDSSDEEKPAEILKTDTTPLVKHKVSTPTPILMSTPTVFSPAKGKTGLPSKSPKTVKTMQVSVNDGKETKRVDTPAPMLAKATAIKGTVTLTKSPKASKVEKVKSASQSKSPVAVKQAATNVSSVDSSSSSNSADEKSLVIKPTSVQTKLENFFTKRTVTQRKTKSKTNSEQPGVPPAACSSETSVVAEESAVKVETPAPATPKSQHKRLSDKAVKSPSTPKTKATSPTKPPAGLKQTVAESSSESSDSEDDLASKRIISSRPSVGDAKGIHDKVIAHDVSKLVSPKKGDNSIDNSGTNQLEESQSLLKVQRPPKRKLSLDKEEDKTSVTKSSKKKSKVQAQPETTPTPIVPTTPEALLESEEETVLALLEGRSPKKAKKASKKTLAAATPTVQISNVLEKSPPPQTPPESKKSKKLKAESPAVPELSQLSEKERSGKKRKSSSENRDSKQKDKKAKKAKKEKKLKAASVVEEASSPTPSKKETSEKSKKKKTDKKDKKKESKKLAQSQIAPVVESTDSGVSLQSKPKKKKKVKGEKD